MIFNHNEIVDFHAHILPGADHGSDSVETSLKQLTLAKNASVNTIIATPHFYPHVHSVEEFLKIRNQAYLSLESAKEADMPKIILGAEVLLCVGIDRLAAIDKLCIEGTKTILIELPFADFSSDYVETVVGLIESGYEVILAHAERYNPAHIEQLRSVGAKLQLNAKVLSKRFVSGSIRTWLKEGSVVAIGSDIHDVDTKAYKYFAKAMKRYVHLIN